MKNTLLRIISLVLCFSFILPLSSCNKESKPNGDIDVPKFKFNSDYTIVRGYAYESSEEIISAIQLIREAVGAVYGEFPTMETDLRRPGDTSVNEYEILVGDTNRDQSQEMIASLGVSDYAYSVESENVIVICGGSPKATLEAAKQFCLDVLGYDPDTKKANAENISVAVGKEVRYTHDYEYENAVINGVDVKDFVIAVKNDKKKDLGYEAAKMFSKLSGAVIPIVEYSELSGSEKAVICIDAADRQGNKSSSLFVGYLVTNDTKDGLLTVSVCATDEKFYSEAFTKLEENLTISENDGNATVSLPAKRIYGTGYKTPNWILKIENKTIIYDGVVYSERVYTDENNLPYRVFMLTVDPTKVNFYTGSNGDGYKNSFEANEKQNVMEHMQAAAQNGVKVIAGINANHFAINDDHAPRGLVIKEGTLVSAGVASRPYFAVTKDGKPIMGEIGTSAKVADIQTAVSGSYYIVHDGLPRNIDMENEFGYTAHPRTLIGLKADNTVVMAVIDGRDQKNSNGASLAKCAELMIGEGALQAINLDGGGSSSFILKEGNKFVTKNDPSDGKLRDLPISLLVVGK